MTYEDDITPGVWFEDGKNCVRGANGVAIGSAFCISDAKLFAEAGTVTNETGKMPRELQQERDEALGALRDIKKIEDRYDQYYMKGTDPAGQEVSRITTETIDKIEGGGDE